MKLVCKSNWEIEECLTVGKSYEAIIVGEDFLITNDEGTNHYFTINESDEYSYLTWFEPVINIDGVSDTKEFITCCDSDHSYINNWINEQTHEHPDANFKVTVKIEKLQ